MNNCYKNTMLQQYPLRKIPSLLRLIDRIFKIFKNKNIYVSMTLKDWVYIKIGWMLLYWDNIVYTFIIIKQYKKYSILKNCHFIINVFMDISDKVEYISFATLERFF